jgi:hypothetical protein
LIKLSWNRFPVWGILWKNGSHFEQKGRHFLCRQKNTFYIFLWNYESIKVGVQLVFNTIWEWHRFTAVIWKNDTKSFIFPKLKIISAQNFEGNTTDSVVHVLLDVMFFLSTQFIKFIRQGTCSKIQVVVLGVWNLHPLADYILVWKVFSLIY